MAQNKLEDLRNHIFMSLERLNDDTLDIQKIELEYKKAKAICSLTAAMIETAKIEVEFMEKTGALKTSSSLFLGLVNQNLID